MPLFRFLIFTLLLLISTVSSFSQDTTYCIDLNKPKFKQFDVFNQDVKDKKIILLGEVHHMAANPIIQVEFWMHLNKHFGVRNLLIEFGRAEAYLYNQYLRTGDEGFLRYTFYGFKQNQEFYTSMRKLYDYNLRLKKSKKLIVHGLDLERDPSLSSAMQHLLSLYSSLPQMSGFLDSIRIRLDTLGVVIDSKEYSSFLKEKVSKFSLPIDENSKMINYILSNKASIQLFSIRDKYMVETFIELDTLGEPFFGQFGSAHTMLDAHYGFMKLLNDLDPYHDNILVIHMLPIDSTSDIDSVGLSDCPIFLYKFNPSGEKLAGLNKRGHWALILKDQKSYLPGKE